MNGTKEIMIAAAAKEIRDGDVAFIGTGLPMMAAYLAIATHAPNAKLIFESGIIGAQPRRLAPGVGDFALESGCAMASGLYYTLSLLQRGLVDVGFLGAAQIDQWGNINTTAIGDYLRPKVRLPGSGGANDIASLAKRTVIIVNHEPRKFVPRLDYLTTPGFIDGPNGRENAHLRGGGPVKVVTNLAVLDFDEDSKRMRLASLHPGVTIEQVRQNTGFDLVIPDQVEVTSVPRDEEVDIIRSLDPNGVYLGKIAG